MRPANLTITVLASPSFSRYKRPSFSGKRLDNIEEERSEYHVNLGSESPRSIMNEDIIAEETSLMARSGIAANTEIPPRTRLWRSSSFTNKMPKRSSSKDWVDRDCGIWYVTRDMSPGSRHQLYSASKWPWCRVERYAVVNFSVWSI